MRHGDTQPIKVDLAGLKAEKPRHGGSIKKGTGMDFGTPSMVDDVEEEQRRRAIVMVRAHSQDAAEAKIFFEMLGLIDA